MKRLITAALRPAAAGLLGLLAATAATAQPLVNQPLVTQQPAAHTAPSATDVPVDPKTEALPKYPSSAASDLLTQGPAAGQTPAQPGTGMSSAPPPFGATGTAPAATNDSNFFEGFKGVQDAFSELAGGKFKNTKYKWYGFVRVDGIYDFKPIKSTDDFVTSSIPIPQGRGENFVLTPRYTRLGWDTETPIESLDWKVKTRIELDFFNGNTSGNFGSFPLRLRFAWADFGPFLIGQAASLFMDYDVFPNVLDYEGPPGMVLVRQPIVSIHHTFCEKFKVSVGIEQPYSDIQWQENGAWVVAPGSGIISTAGASRNIQDVPDITGNVRYEGDYGHIQVAGIVRKLTFQPAVGATALDVVGYGVNVTGTIHPWAILCNTPRTGDCATPLSKSRFIYQFAAGDGINRYIQDVNGLGLDATFDPVNGFRAIPALGWFIAYEQWWCKKWASVFTYGETRNDLTNTLPGSTYKQANYATANLIWLPVERMGVGLEFLYGSRENKDGTRGDAGRIQTAFQYKF